MKKLLLVLTIINTLGFSHPGKTDYKGGHNCSVKSKSKGLCTGYHYHNGKTVNKSKKVSVHFKSTTENKIMEMQQLLKDCGYYRGKTDGIIGKVTQRAAKNYLKDQNYDNPKLNKLLKINGLM